MTGLEAFQVPADCPTTRGKGGGVSINRFYRARGALMDEAGGGGGLLRPAEKGGGGFRITNGVKF